ARTEKESERLIAIHHDEQKMIEGTLAQVVPANFFDACCLLKFVIGRITECGAEDAEIAMLQHVMEGLSFAWIDALKAEHEKGMEEMRRIINFVTENSRSVLDGELAVRRSLDRRAPA
ncbi:MAG: hypothetical protein WBG11_14020, partial [Methylocella sp.]